MEKEKLQEFAARVTQANRSELVVIIYEAALASIAEGKKQLEDGELPQARKEIERAKDMLDELMRSLDMQYTISHYLRQLYVYAYRELCQGIALHQPELFAHATGVLEGLLPSFKEVASQDDSAPVMENVQQIYAGLTYGPNSLNETTAMDMTKKRGFEA
ncbi:MAG: flagellar protein FliS [Lachnospiraceae bacterium]|nr:flagellar protein FliS [Lachnospiraceae bacterium]